VKDFEIGQVYLLPRLEMHFLAIDKHTLLTHNGRWAERTVMYKRPYKPVTVSVENLAEDWGIPVEEIDRIAEKYFHVRIEEGPGDSRPSHRTAQRDELQNPRHPPCLARVL
jgi:hypothetical protein